MVRAKKPSANRTDLLTPNAQPVTTPTGLPYGENKALAGAQAQAPLPGGAPQPTLAQLALQSATATPAPSQPIHAPTNRPNEPLTAGMTPVGTPGALPDPTLQQLQGIYAQTANPYILEYIKEQRARQGMR